MGVLRSTTDMSHQVTVNGVEVGYMAFGRPDGSPSEPGDVAGVGTFYVAADGAFPTGVLHGDGTVTPDPEETP